MAAISTVWGVGLFTAPQLPTDALDELIYFLVDTPDGPVGVLDEVKTDEHGNPATLIIAQGWFGRRKLQVPSDSIVGIDHPARLITLARGAAPLEASRWLRFFG